MKRIIALLTIVAAAVGLAAPSATHAQTPQTWRVVGTGDSILAMAAHKPATGGYVLTADAWLDMEYGRDPYLAGMAGRASTASLWPLILARSQPGGWIIIQDNGLQASDTGWRTLMQRIVDETPDDRCIAFVPPVYHWTLSAELHYRTTTLANIQAEVAVAAGAAGQCYQIVPWRQTVLCGGNTTPCDWALGRTYVCDPDATPDYRPVADLINALPSRCDGQHPSRRGQDWLVFAVEFYTGVAIR